MLYPLKFFPILKPKLWGGNRIKKYHAHNVSDMEHIGESWDISAVPGDESIVMNGFLADNNLEEVLEIYMGELVGDAVYARYGNDFPLLVKLIDAHDKLSIQVHPNDELALNRHDCSGKNEMWYVMDATDDAFIIAGFKEKIDKESYLKHVNEHSLEQALQRYSVKRGDVFYVPAGCVHSIGGGCLILEVQQSSDITYRIYDYNRLQDDGTPRELHTDEALDAIDFSCVKSQQIIPEPISAIRSRLIEGNCFTANLMIIDTPTFYDLSALSSFVILTCVEGKVSCLDGDERMELAMGESMLIPAMMESLTIEPIEGSKLLEVYIEVSRELTN